MAVNGPLRALASLSPGKNPRYAFSSRVVEPQNRSEQFWRREKSVAPYRDCYRQHVKHRMSGEFSALLYVIVLAL
jgi:hypothetical protein